MTQHTDAAFADWGADIDGKPHAHVVVFPGRGETPKAYRRLAKRIGIDSVRTIVYQGAHVDDLPDSGGDIGRLATQAIEALGDPDGKPVILLGSDTGALTALHVAHDLAGRVTALILAGLPDGTIINDADFGRELDIRSACTSYRGILQDEQGVRWGEILRRPIPSYLQNETRAERIKVPVLVFQGDRDELSDIEAIRRFAGTIPKAKLFVVKHGRHDVLNDHDHRAVGSQITFFIQRTRRGAELPPILEDALDTIGA